MRVGFTFRELEDAGVIYAPLCDELFMILRKVTPDIELSYLKGHTYYSVLCHSVIAYDRCFWQLAKNKEVIAAYPLIRLQADTLRVLVAEYLYPNKVLSAIYEKGKELNQIKINDEKLSPAFITEKTNELFKRFREIYKRYNHFAHPSEKLNLNWLNKKQTKDDPEAREMRRAHQTIKRTVGEWDMVYLNKCIVYTLLLILSNGYKALSRNRSNPRIEKALIKKHPDYKLTEENENSQSD